jgi:hypothetical protein
MTLILSDKARIEQRTRALHSEQPYDGATRFITRVVERVDHFITFTTAASLISKTAVGGQRR